MKSCRLSGLLQVPVPDLVFFRIQIFFAALIPGPVLTEFKRRAIDAIGGAERGGEYQARHEGRPATVLEVFRQNIRGVGPQVRTEILAHFRLGQLGEVARQLLPGVAPGKVGVGLRKAALGQSILHLGAGERLGQEK